MPCVDVPVAAGPGTLGGAGHRLRWGPMTSHHPYRRIVEDLRRAIEQGRYRPGDAVPSQAELCEQYGVTSGTARSALQRLVSDGVLIPVAGKGYYVRGYSRRPVRVQVTREPEGEVLVQAVRPPAILSDLLGGDDLVVRRRAIAGDAIRDRYYPGWVVERAPRLGQTLPVEDDLGEVSEAAILLQPEVPVRVISRMPTPEETRLLRLPQGTTVLEHAAILYCLDGRVVSARVATAAGDRYQLDFTTSLNWGG